MVCLITLDAAASNTVELQFVLLISLYVWLRRHGKPGGDGGKDKTNKSGFGAATHAGR